MSMSESERFKKVYSQGIYTAMQEVWVDTETGVNYLFCISDNAGGLTPLIDKDGRPVVTNEFNSVGFKPQE